jgi:DDE superfamily endonuclease
VHDVFEFYAKIRNVAEMTSTTTLAARRRRRRFRRTRWALNRKLYGYAIVTAIDASRPRRKYRRASVLTVEHSFWRNFRRCTCDQSWMAHLAVDRETFFCLVDCASAYLDTGRSALDEADLVAMALRYLRTSSSQLVLANEFGVLESAFSQGLRAGMTALSRCLAHVPHARIAWPSHDEKYVMHQALSAFVLPRHPSANLGMAWGMVDGMTIRMCNPSDGFLQNRYYSGYKRQCCVTNVFVFGADGCIVWARVNAKGSMHDSKTAVPLYRKLQADAASCPYQRSWCVLADSAFKGSRDGSDGVMKVFTMATLLSMTPAEQRTFKQRHREITSARVAAEWGMGALRNTFTRLQTDLLVRYEFNHMMIIVAARLHNLHPKHGTDSHSLH